MYHHLFHSPVGVLQLSARSGRLLSLQFGADDAAYSQPSCVDRSYEPVLDTACKQLDEYFAGSRHQFDVHMAMQGTPLQLRVWSFLLRIPYGMTVSHNDLTKAVGGKFDCRSVVHAIASNPIPILVPSHRVIVADGSFAGVVGGGQVKRALLEQERAGSGLFAAAMA